MSNKPDTTKSDGTMRKIFNLGRLKTRGYEAVLDLLLISQLLSAGTRAAGVVFGIVGLSRVSGISVATFCAFVGGLVGVSRKGNTLHRSLLNSLSMNDDVKLPANELPFSPSKSARPIVRLANHVLSGALGPSRKTNIAR
jgi:hypothetical protein